MLSRNFRLQKVGNLNWLERNYKFQKIAFSIDELIVLNATKENKSILEFASMVSNLVNDVFIPIAAGGGIKSVQDAEILFNNGADKIVINSLLIENPKVVNQLVQKYGSQSIVACIDYKKINGVNEVYIHDGTTKVDIEFEDYIRYVLELDIGELYLNSMDKDGTGFGYDLETIKSVGGNISVPLIIAGGAGNESHLIDGLGNDNVSAVATANLFNFVGNGLPNARTKILESGLNIANWNVNN